MSQSWDNVDELDTGCSLISIVCMRNKNGEKAPICLQKLLNLLDGQSCAWDRYHAHALDLGWKAVQDLKMLSRVMSHHG